VRNKIKGEEREKNGRNRKKSIENKKI